MYTRIVVPQIKVDDGHSADTVVLVWNDFLLPRHSEQIMDVLDFDVVQYNFRTEYSID